MNSLLKTAVVLSFFGLVVAGAKEPRELTELRKVQRELVERATAPAAKKYQEALQRLILDFTKQGKLEEANAVKRELAITWCDGAWYVSKNGNPSEWVSIYADGKVVSDALIAGAWEPEDAGIKITWTNGTTWTLEPARDGKSLTGKAPGSTNLKFTRQKVE
jgi:hypothetical protein